MEIGYIIYKTPFTSERLFKRSGHKTKYIISSIKWFLWRTCFMALPLMRKKKEVYSMIQGSIPYKLNTNSLYTQTITAFGCCLHFNTQLNFKSLMFVSIYDTLCSSKDNKLHIGIIFVLCAFIIKFVHILQQYFYRVKITTHHFLNFIKCMMVKKDTSRND